MSENRALVVTYHAICEGPPPLCQAPEQLERQLDALENSGFQAVSLSAVIEALLSGAQLPATCYALTFDDAYRDFAEAALPILRQRDIPSTLFATASADRETLPGGTGASLLPLEELAALREQGVEIGAHSVSHVDLTSLSDGALEFELRECKQVLERHSGGPVRDFAYPLGCFDRRVHAAVGREFRSACTTQLSRVGARADPLAIPRVDAHYLRSPLFQTLLGRAKPDLYLAVRRQLRRLRGSEPRTRLRHSKHTAWPENQHA